ncbi:MAG: proprotein convertase P-domain-containing protein [Phycisphaerales bacterium]|jgi:subtilisin-like proprotein convertase family protein
MYTRSGLKLILAGLFGVIAFSLTVCADEVHIYEEDFDLQIPADPSSSQGWMIDAVIEVDSHLSISDIDVGITLMHSNVFDLQITLQSPDGTTLCLNSYDPESEFFEGADYSQTVFDDEAQTDISQGEAPFTGRFRPDSAEGLEVFDGQDACGPWRLQIYDAYHSDTGTLESVALVITAPEPSTVILFMLGAALAAFLQPRRV